MEVRESSKGLVSVIMPAYGTASYIAAAIDSVLAQTYQQYEIVVVNDGSPDTELLETVLDPYRDRIVYIVRENGGLGGARNTAIRAARGEYVAMLDSDDYWAPEYLESQVSVMDADPTIDVVYPDAIWFSHDGKTRRQFSEEHNVGGNLSFFEVLARDVQVYGGATARRESLLRVGLYDEALRTGEDFDLWIRILKAGGRIAYNDRVLAYYRGRPGSLTSDRHQLQRNMVDLLDRFGEKMDLTADERAALDHQRMLVAARLAVSESKQALLAGDSRTAITRLRAAAYLESWKLEAIILSLRVAPGFLRSLYRLRDWWEKPRRRVQEQ